MQQMMLIAILVFLLSSVGCGAESGQPDSATGKSLPAQAASTPPQEGSTRQRAKELTQYSERAGSDDAESVEEALFHGVARALVIRHVEPNKLSVGGQEFRVKRNPSGPGCFVYDPRTRFAGVERNLVWLVLDESRAYALNSPSKMVTPALKWPRDDGIIRSPSTSAIVDYVFRGKSISTRELTPSPEQPDSGTFTVAEYRIYRMVLDTPMSISEPESLARAAKQHQVTIDRVREVVNRVQRELFSNNWMGRPESEIRHASDWKDEAK